MEVLKIANLGIRFILELCALSIACYLGFKSGTTKWLKIILGIGSPLFLAILWGTFGAPKAPIKLSSGLHFLLEVGAFGSPAILLYAAGKPKLAFVYLFIVIINRILMYVWGQ